MSLSEENRTLLQLLLVREKSYADIASLLGVSEDDVADRAQDALASLAPGGSRPDARMTAYLLGQADPIAAAEARREIASKAKVATVAGDIEDQLRLLFPKAKLSPLETGAVEAPIKLQPSESPIPATKTLTADNRRLVALLAVAGLLGLIIILLLTGVLGGSDDKSDKQNQSEPTPTKAALTPVDGQQGKGTVEIGFSGSSLAANLNFTDLKPSSKNEVYALWFYGSTGAFPVATPQVEKDGKLAGQIPLNEAILCLVAGDIFPEMRLSRASAEEVDRAVVQARKANNGKGEIPEYVGTTVLTGRVSMPQEAKDQIMPVCNGATQTDAE